MAFHEYSENDIKNRIAIDNPWWLEGKIDPFYSRLPPRPYLRLLLPLILQKEPLRAVVLMGPRRVGKTVLLHHVIQELINRQNDPENIIYASVNTPIYTRLPLERILSLAIDVAEKTKKGSLYVFFDEIQYLKDWEIHLKSLVDTYKNIKFIVSGSAAAALRLKSIESGAGRFTDFVLPPLTFYEFIELSGESVNYSMREQKRNRIFILDDDTKISNLNNLFEDYINYGGYPELLQRGELHKSIDRYIKGDIIEKVLLKDLPGLYGIQDIQELNALFSSLAYNTGKETSLESLSKLPVLQKIRLKDTLNIFRPHFLSGYSEGWTLIQSSSKEIISLRSTSSIRQCGALYSLHCKWTVLTLDHWWRLQFSPSGSIPMIRINFMHAGGMGRWILYS